ncbi:hypothetical protein BV25DRAFT_1252429 [Artomyces pyxidatus]|uniref:Uncharacterized protein n=1 Tax=Artomyces pyxidatus TaxID=48021 RepID=A0ACB8TEL6_9AGAM|nr:hypothetical protein BV25DRAFT_1252429 [Artomyces pyxidatus]
MGHPRRAAPGIRGYDAWAQRLQEMRSGAAVPVLRKGPGRAGDVPAHRVRRACKWPCGSARDREARADARRRMRLLRGKTDDIGAVTPPAPRIAGGQISPRAVCRVGERRHGAREGEDSIRNWVGVTASRELMGSVAVGAPDSGVPDPLSRAVRRVVAGESGCGPGIEAGAAESVAVHALQCRMRYSVRGG